MFGRRHTRDVANPLVWWYHVARSGRTVHVCDDIPERPPGYRRIEALHLSAAPSHYRGRNFVLTIELEGDDRWWTPEQLHVRER